MAMIIKAMQGGAITPRASILIFMTMAGTIGAGEATMATEAFTDITTLGIGTDGTTGDGEVTMDMVDIIPRIAVMDMDITEGIMEIDIIIMKIEATHTTEADAATIIGIP